MAAAPITTELKFLADLDKPLVYVPSKGGGDTTDHVGNFVMRNVEVHDGRNLDSPDLDVEGFRLVRQPTNVSNFYDDAQIASTYHDEISALLKESTGASRVEFRLGQRRTCVHRTHA